MTKNLLTGFIPEEDEISTNINKVWTDFNKLEQTHPNDIDEFHGAIHTLQRIMGTRILRRDYPDFWLVKKRRNNYHICAC